MRFQILQPARLMRHATVLMSLRLECSVNRACVTVSCLHGFANRPFVFSHVEYCDMHFVYGFCNGNARAAVEEYRRRFLDRRIPSRGVFTRINQTLRDTGCLPVLLCGLKGRWYERLTHERTFLRWFREIHVCPLVKWPLASAYHVCRCGELYIRKIYILTTIKEYNIWNHSTMLNVWICAAG